MHGDLQNWTLDLIGPGTFLVFAVAFVWAWVISAGRHYLLLIAGCCLLASAGGVFRLAVGWPSDAGINILISNMFYVGTTLAGCEGILRRYGHRIGLAADLAILAASAGLTLCFVYVEPSFVMRIYIQNFVPGTIFLVTGLRLRRLARASHAERVMFWVLIVFAVQFYPRTILTLAFAPEPDLLGFDRSVFWQVLQLTNAVMGTALLLAVLVAELSTIIKRLQVERDVDRLTGILNRRGFEDRAEAILAQGPLRDFALILFDIDHFKGVNDTFGHAAGDEVLRALGGLLRATVHPDEPIGRIGGEEFALLLPDGNADSARTAVVRLQRAIERADFALPAHAVPIAASFGIAVRRPGEPYLDWFKRADTALYRAKSEGRKKAVFAAR
ncbi:diguanylate cyclase (GGDEF)-like protein [Amorphus sp. MBR-141]